MIDPKQALAGMTLDQKAAHMVMAGFNGLTAPDDMFTLIRRGLGSAILFARNLTGPEQAAALTGELQKAALDAQGLPLLIAADQEGGIVVRLTAGVSVMPGNMALGATRSAELAYKAAFTVGRELARLGINMNLAPVLDVNNNPANPVIGVRSYGADPALVAALGSAQVRGYQDGGILATAKHFPGHGDTALDSHSARPLVPHSLQHLAEVELVPFKAAIAAGIGAIMTAHVVFPAVEPDAEIPATLSPAVLTGLLRQQLGFNGIIITDSMGMKGITACFEPGEAAVRAVIAGADIIAVCHNMERQEASIAAIVEAVQARRIAESRLDESVLRILHAKMRYAHPESVDALKTVAPTVTPLEIARQAVTVLRNNGVLPLPKGHWLLVEPGELAHTGEAGTSPTPSLAEFLAPALGELTVEGVPLTPTEADTARVVASAAGCRGAIVVTRYATRQPAQAQMVQALVEAGITVVVAALPNPYDVAVCPGAAAVLTAYDVHRAAVQATCEVLMGAISVSGRLPVSLPEMQS